MAARIRSMHPGLFTDDAFVSCSPFARLLVLGIWTEADDHGVFEWKPTSLKLKLLPADDAKIPELLDELVAANVIKQVSIDGRAYGLVRNFCRFQRPQKPTFRIELPEEYWSYVGLKATGSYPNPTRNPHRSGTGTVPVPHHSGSAPGKVAQMEEGGGRKKEGRKKDSNHIDKSVVVVPPTPPKMPAGTTTTKVAEGIGLQKLPLVTPTSPLGTALPETWVPDDGCIEVAHSHGMTDAEIDTEVLRFHALNTQRGTFSQNWNSTWTLWCAEFKRRKDAEAAKAAPRVEVNAPHQPTKSEWMNAVRRWKSNNSLWSRHLGPSPDLPTCRCPADVLAELGIQPVTLPSQRSSQLPCDTRARPAGATPAI